MGTSELSEQAWWRGAVVYQIWPRSFMDGDGDGIGDLPGIIEKLDYLNDGHGGGLGVDAVWISPFFTSPQADFGYDVSDYTSIDPTFGSIEDFDLLIEEASRRSIRVLLDLVPNHTSDRHPWFLESKSSKSSAKRDWYVWKDPGPDGGPPNNWQSAFGDVGPAWTFDEGTGQFYLNSYTKNQPDLNWENPEVREAIKDVMRFWFDRGVSGFRIDVVHRLAKDPEFADNPPGSEGPEPESPGRHDADWHSIDRRLFDLRSVSDEYSERLLVGEVYILDQRRLIDYLGPEKLHLGHNFVFLNQPWVGPAISATLTEFEELAPAGVDGAWCLNNHDHSRTATRFGEDGFGIEKARAAAVMLLALRGTCFLYQGEELGLPDTRIVDSVKVDIDGRDGCRTPIPWESPTEQAPGAGFTNGVPWLPIGDTAGTLNVAAEYADPSSTYWLYRNLISARKSSLALREGVFASRGLINDVFVFDRIADDQLVRCVVNFGPTEQTLSNKVSPASMNVLVSSVADPDPKSLAGHEARLLTQEIPQKNS